MIWLIWISGIAICFNSLINGISKKVTSIRIHRITFLFQIIVSYLIVLFGYRFLLKAGLGLSELYDSHGFITTGIFYNIPDTLSYLSWAKQANLGSYFFTNLGAVESHSPIYFNPFFLMIGKIASWLNLPIFSIYYIVGIITIPIIISVIFYCTLNVGIPENGARWATIFAAFSSGLSAQLFLLGYLLHFSPPKGTDITVLDSIISSTLLVYPLHAFAVAFLGIAILLILLIDNDKLSLKKYIVLSFALYFTSSLLTFTHPYETGLFLLSYFIFWVVSVITNDRKIIIRRLYILIIVLIGTLPIILYYYILGHQPVWVDCFNTLLDESLRKTRVAWLIGYGFILPLALFGGYHSFKKLENEKARWLMIWIILLTLFLIVVNVRQIKISNGGYFPMCILAGYGFIELSGIINKFEPILFKRIGQTILTLVLLSVFITFPSYLIEFSRHAYDVEIKYATEKIRAISKEKYPIVLCDYQTGYLIPVISGLRVYAGHYLTPNFSRKRGNLIKAGIGNPEFFDKKDFQINLTNFIGLLKENELNYLLIKNDTPAYSYAKQVNGLCLIHYYKRWSLYYIGVDLRER
jgi:hypothetical protein